MIITLTVKHGGGSKVVNTWTTCCNWWNRESCAVSENPEGESPTISSLPDAQAYSGYTEGQRSGSTSGWLKKYIYFLNFLEWPHKSLDLKSIEMLETPPVWLNENNSAKNSGPIFPHCDVKDSLVPVVEQPLLGRVFFSLMKIII